MMSEKENAKQRQDEAAAREQLEYCASEAEQILDHPDKVEHILQRIEQKLKEIPALGEGLAEIPVLVSLIRSYIRKEYTLLPVASAVAILAALLYFVSPIDLIPDVIPLAGYVDDALVVTLCFKVVSADVDEYRHWRKTQGKQIDMPDGA